MSLLNRLRQVIGLPEDATQDDVVKWVREVKGYVQYADSEQARINASHREEIERIHTARDEREKSLVCEANASHEECAKQQKRINEMNVTIAMLYAQLENYRAEYGWMDGPQASESTYGKCEQSDHHRASR